LASKASGKSSPTSLRTLGEVIRDLAVEIHAVVVEANLDSPPACRGWRQRYRQGPLTSGHLRPFNADWLAALADEWPSPRQH
jgi:hypothetical protein